MITHNICFHGEIRKILSGYSLLSEAMHSIPLKMTWSDLCLINTYLHMQNIQYFHHSAEESCFQFDV